MDHQPETPLFGGKETAYLMSCCRKIAAKPAQIRHKNPMIADL
jgi:hypothetical protein